MNNWIIWMIPFAIINLNSCKGQSNYSPSENNSRQSKKYSLSCCINAELIKVASNIHPRRLIPNSNKVGNYSLRIANENIFIQNRMLQNSVVTQWMEEADVDSINFYGCEINDCSYFLLSSRVLRATGLATNITIWLVIDAEKGFSYNINSLANDVDLFYVQDNNLRAISIDYSDEFLESKDYDDISFKVTQCTFIDQRRKIILETTSKCPCK